ncbi:zinc finger dihydrouridine synthase [Moniliophthora roreri MCA 2997]|uniref:tRNA-dihydrouridine(47) synthase [NAD(P)(+)] n=1 Tax=Moniliophthora roreri (strain MCA 2997) TaxID=1381753 RepID=V2XT94_MONRO|nr:zinc finger dihydrouridine synthase [Moniliophthora roreri MCA 2997]
METSFSPKLPETTLHQYHVLLQSNHTSPRRQTTSTPPVPGTPRKIASTGLVKLLTVGNLPFRRSYVDYGADITCGEMVLATSFLSGSKEEWPLVRRHPSEKAFGVQVAGSKLNALVPTAETGNGSARTFPYRHVSSWDVKLRTGVKHGKNTAHKTMSRLFLEVENGIGALTVRFHLVPGTERGADKKPELVTWPNMTTNTKLADWD